MSRCRLVAPPSNESACLQVTPAGQVLGSLVSGRCHDADGDLLLASGHQRILHDILLRKVAAALFLWTVDAHVAALVVASVMAAGQQQRLQHAAGCRSE